MPDTPDLPDLARIGEAEQVRPRRWAPQLVWIIPIIAVLIGGWLAIHAWLERGPTITISFLSGEGLEPGKTRIKYKDVDIGQVKSLTLSDDAKRVIVTAEMTKQAERLLVDDTSFWVVRPRISGGNVSGLSTLLGGAYVGVDVGKSSEDRREFVGLDVPPVVTLDAPGRRYVLHGDDLGSLDVGSPVYLHRVQVGQVVAFELDPDGRGVTLIVFVRSPYDKYVTRATRFWQASGVDLNLDANGVKLDTQSLVTILLGGIAFQTPDEDQAAEAKPAEENATYTLFLDRSEAMRNPDLVSENYLVVFRESVRGLNVGAPVDFRGLIVGEVTAIHLEVDAANKQVTVPVEIRLYPERLRARSRKKAGQPFDSALLLKHFVEGGFRAQLRTANLISGQLYIALDFFHDAKKASFDPTRQPLELPTQPGSLEELQKTLTSIAAKLDKLPVDKIAGDLRAALQSLDRTLKDTDGLVKRVDSDITPDAKAAIADLRKTMEDARTTLQQAGGALAGDAPLQQNAREALREVTRAAQALRTLADTIERHPESLLRGKQKEEQP